MASRASPRAILVTGAASGIGRATACLFARRGWTVGAFDRDEPGLDTLRDEVGAERVTTGVLDVTDLAAFGRAVDTLLGVTAGRLDALFNCAGLLRCGPFESQTPADDRAILEVNVLGVLNGIRAALPALKATPGAQIVTMSSSAAFYGVPEEAVYSASKFAVRALTEALDIELERHGISVCDIMPPVVRTPMVTEQTFEPAVNKNLANWMAPDAVAEVVWRAVHERRLHWMPSRQLRLFGTVMRLLPFLARPLMKRLSTHPAGR